MDLEPDRPKLVSFADRSFSVSLFIMRLDIHNSVFGNMKMVNDVFPVFFCIVPQYFPMIVLTCVVCSCKLCTRVHEFLEKMM